MNLEEELIELMNKKAFEMLDKGINKSGLEVETSLNTILAKTTPEAKWVEPMVKAILSRFNAIQGAYAMLTIGNKGDETLITLKRNPDIANHYSATLGLSFTDPMNTRNLAIMLHGGELMGDEIAQKTDDGEKVIVNARVGYDGDVANAIGEELSSWFKDYLSDTDKEIKDLNKRIKEASE